MNWEDNTNRPNYLSEVTLINLKPKTLEWYGNGIKSAILYRYGRIKLWAVRYSGYLRFQLGNVINRILNNKHES
jgi:hypothetical protein